MAHDHSRFPSFPPSEFDADASFTFIPPSSSSDLTFMMDEDQEVERVEPKFRSEVKLFTDFLKTHTCYEMIPASGKIVVLDVSLDIKVAFRALIENRIKSAPLWDSEKGDYVGMITVSDFINILRHFYHAQEPDSFQLPLQEKNQIKHWREILPNNIHDELVSIHPDDTIFKAAETLVEYHIHRIPIVDRENNNSTLHVLSHSRILTFLLSNVQDPNREKLMRRSVVELGIGTYNNVVSVLKDTPLIVALDMLVEREISAVPLVDETGVVIAVYSRSDAADLAKHPKILSELENPVQQFVGSKKVCTCKKTDSLQKVLVEKVLGCNARRVVCVDSTNRVTGIISQSDMLRFFLSNA